MSQRTRTHYYPAEEVTAMQNKYGGKRCIYSQRDAAVEWSHQLDAALDSTRRLEWMLARNLRQDRHPLHATEVRENLVPVSVELHARSNRGVPTLTLFPHVEDVLARSLEYELQIASPRCKQGALPPYEVGYDGLHIDYRAHMPGNRPSTWGIYRFEDRVHYSPIQCPGIRVPGGLQPFPVIHTLLSVPFVVLHQAPRLISMSPLTPDQSKVLLVIMQLWSWDPDVVAGPQGVAVAASNNIFQDVPSIASRTATLETISSRIVEVQAFAPGPAPAPSLEQT
ncbi:hypothetical protein C8J57DRAFT_1267330, partial [Mycena rebaudengoi]